MAQDTDDPKTKAEFDRAMTAANVFRLRGDYAQAAKSVQQALALRPTDLEARELAADIIYAHGDIARAAEHYKSILEDDPTRASAEEKYAKAILDVAEGQRQQQLLKDMLEHPKQHRAQARNSTLAALLSIAPGFGQVYCAHYVKGMIIFVAWALSWVLSLALVGPAGRNVLDCLTAGTIFFGCLATSIHLYAVVDAASCAEKTRGDKSLTEP